MHSHTLKPLPSTLRERKRYLVFEVLSKHTNIPLAKASKAIAFTYASLHGSKGAANAGLLYISKRSHDEVSRGMMRVNRKYITDLKASLPLIKEIDGHDVIIRSVGVSGMIKKAESKFMAS